MRLAVVTAGALAFAWLVALTASAPGPLFAQDGEEASVEHALVRPLAEESLLLDGASADGLLVAVGERGHILHSRDNGATWTQAALVPTRAALTAVYLHDNQLGWAVGHDATILRTDDGGVTWETQYSAPEEELPFLDVRFEDADNGVAIGAYGYFLETSDGGANWSFADFAPTSAEDEAEEEEDDPFAYDEGGDMHLNHVIRAESGRLYIAAEAGTAYRSDDNGESWTTLPSPYRGSFFSSLPLEGDLVLLFGLRGHLFRSDDAGETWQEIDTGTQAILTDGIRLEDGRVVVVGLEGTILVSDDGGSSFSLKAQADRQGYSAVLPHADGGIILFGEFGATVLPASVIDAGDAG
ncbi:MAG: WD40/YVTN/BNR-like repeat-containing protein [Thermoanaerobaculia bacterium]